MEAPRLLLATTTWWPSLAVLASAFEQAGFDVVMLCPRGNVGFKARRFTCREMDGRRPIAALVKAIEAVRPAMVVPGDERMVCFLRRLHAEQPRWRATVEQAIGAPSGHHLLTARVPLLRAAAAAGFCTPETRVLSSEADLEAWLGHVPPPWVLKVDGAWGGEGVRMAMTRPEAYAAFRELRRGVPFSLALRRRMVNRDPFPWQDRRARQAPSVSAQVFVPGRPGNCAVFARDGKLLGATVVEAVTTCGDRGPSTLVEAVDRPEVVDAAARLVAGRGLSGFLGFDFIADPAGGAALIEMNPRVTMPCRMQGPFGLAPVTAAALAHGAMSRNGRATPARDLFASFPLAWLLDPTAPALAGCAGDLPWQEPGLLRDALRPLWPERGLLASLPGRFRVVLAAARGRPQPDYRRRSFAWWLEQGGLDATRSVQHPAVAQVPILPEAGLVEADAHRA